MTGGQTRTFPECASDLEDGFLGHSSGLLWHAEKLSGLRRIFPIAMATGRFVIGNAASSGLFTSRPACRCTACGTIVLPPPPRRQEG